MALRRFTPDLDLYDPNDPEGWIGTWEHDDGSSLYGQGDPDMGQELLAQNDAQPVGPEGEAPPVPGQQALEANAPRADFVSPYQSQNQTPAPAPRVQGAGVQQSSPAPMAGADAVAPRAGWEDDVPPQVASALREQAEGAGLNPDILAAIINHESGWDPSRVNKDTGKHGGLIQFDRDVTWPGVAKAAGRPDVTWEQALGMSAEEQIPFVVAYYKDKGLAPESSAGDYYKRTFMPGFAGEKDDFVLGERGSDARVGNLRSGTVYDQNQGLDLDKDGRITNAEVAQTGERKYAAQGGAGAPQPPANRATGRAGMAPPGQPYPDTFQGMPAAQATMRGVPMTPGQIDERQRSVADRYAAQAQVQQAVGAARVQGRTEVMNEWQRQHQQQQTDARAEEEKQAKIALDAQTKIDREVNQPIQKVNPKRYVQNMSTGDKILGAIAIIADAFGQAAHASIGINRPNVAVQFLQKAIEDDISAQKDDIEQGRAQSQNRVQHWTRVLGNAEMGERAARAEAKQAAGGLLQAKAMGNDIAELQAAQLEQAGKLFAEAQQEVAGIVDKERERMTIQYETPKPTAAGPDKLLERIRALKETEQELRMSGASEEEIAGFFKANGLARLGGETVPQATARQGIERKEDEETSKELQPVSEAEDMWRRALKQLDDIEAKPFVGSRYKPGGFIEGGTANWPGFPSIDEQNAFDQAITAATNAQIAALGRASDSDEDRIKHETIGGGDVRSYRRGIMNQIEKLEKRRQMLSSRREGSAERVGAREEEERKKLRKVSSPVYIPGAGPLR